MKRLALAIGLTAYVVFGSAGSSLAAYRADNTGGLAEVRDGRIAWLETGTSDLFCAGESCFYAE